MFNYFKKRFSRKRNQNSKNGFTLAELLVASAISAVVLSIAYSLVNVILTSNKNDNTNIALSTKIENALDFVVDEVKSSKNVISSWNDVPARCRGNDEFVLGLTLPDQALTNDSYKKKNNVEIKTILTKSGKEFVTPLSVTTLTKNKTFEDVFDKNSEAEIDHISLSRWADIIIVLPTTANFMTKLSVGKAEDLATTVL